MTWSQFHGHAANGGHASVTTSFPITPAWSVPVGQVVFSSPVIDIDGNIYVGNIDGQLVAVSPAGVELWRTTFENSRIAASPAIDTEGHIYVITLQPVGEDRFISVLNKVRNTGSIMWSLQLPDSCWSTASPTIWSSGRDEFIFIYGFAQPVGSQPKGAIYILDVNSNLLHSEYLDCDYGDLVGSGSFWDFLKDIWDALTNIPYKFDGSTPLINLTDTVGWQHPTIAVEDTVSPVTPIVVVADWICALWGFSWDPDTRTLSYLWHQEPKPARYFSSPAVGAGGMVTIGRADGRVLGFEVQGGTQIWEYEAGSGVMATAAYRLGIGPIYIVTFDKIRVLGLAGILWRTFDIYGQSIASPALSKNILYVSTVSGFYGFSDNLSSYFFDGSISGGLSSPAISEQGSVYTVGISSGEWVLRAYPSLDISTTPITSSYTGQTTDTANQTT